MRHYLFEIIAGYYEGEEFIVGADNITEAYDIAAEEVDGNIRYLCELSEEEAEASGLDEY